MKLLSSDIPTKLWTTYEFDEIVSIEDIALKILDDTGIRLIKTGPNQKVHGFLVGENTSEGTKAYVYLYTRPRPKKIVKEGYERGGPPINVELPEISVYTPKKDDLDKIKNYKAKEVSQVIL